MRKIAHFIATCGPIGHTKFAPGTWGSFVGLFLVILLNRFPQFYFLGLLGVFILAVWASNITSSDLKNEDPSCVVIDEVCGVVVSLFFVSISWEHLMFGFIGFRLFDIWKPYPIRKIEHLPNGFGIVLDDVLAGVYTNLILQVLVRYAHL